MIEKKPSKLRILVNGSTLVIGGGIQVGVTFIECAFKSYIDKIDFIFVVAKPLFDNLSLELQSKENIISFETSPAAIIGGKKTRIAIKKIVNEFNPDLIYSIGFPSYIRFKVPEAGRYTNGWEINPPPLPWHTIEAKKKLKFFLGLQYRLLWARNAKYFETQTETAKLGIIRKLGVGSDKVKIIPNSPNPIFYNKDEVFHFERNEIIKIFCLSAAYRHKNLEIIPEVALYLKNKYAIKVEFILTLPKESPILEAIISKAQKLNIEETIKNIGKLNLVDCIDWYKKTHLVFLPTLLEIFSATYIEAMAMRRPIVTTNLDFATEICGDAALYYKSDSPEAAADEIAKLVNNKHIQSTLVENGIKQLAYFPNHEKKNQMLFNWIEELAQISRIKK